MPSRRPYWAVYELREGKFWPTSRAYDNVDEAEEKLGELSKKEEFREKELVVRIASYPVDPRKPSPRHKQ